MVNLSGGRGGRSCVGSAWTLSSPGTGGTIDGCYFVNGSTPRRGPARGSSWGVQPSCGDGLVHRSPGLASTGQGATSGVATATFRVADGFLTSAGRSCLPVDVLVRAVCRGSSTPYPLREMLGQWSIEFANVFDDPSDPGAKMDFLKERIGIRWDSDTPPSSASIS